MQLTSRTEPKWTRQMILTIALIGAMVYVFVIPVSNNYFLYPLLAFIGIGAAVVVIRSRGTRFTFFVAPMAVWTVFMTYAIAVAVVRGAESWLRTLVFLLVWPTFYMVIVGAFPKRLIKPLLTTGAVTTLAISGTFLLGAAMALGLVPGELPVWLTTPIHLRYVVDEGGVVALSSHSLPPLLWWTPMWVASLACKNGDPYLPPMWIRFIVAGVAIAASIVAWRRAIVIVVLMAPVIMVVIWVLMRYRNGPRSIEPTFVGRSAVRIVACYLVAFVLAMSIQAQAPTMVASSFRSAAGVVGIELTASRESNADLHSETPQGRGDAIADDIRENERDSLLSPESVSDTLVGHGIGASFDRGGVQRDMRAWQTELQYHGMFYWTGLIGMTLIAATAIAYLHVVRRAYSVSGTTSGVLFVSCVGAVALLLGNATNPYIQAPGHMWPLFLPLMIAGVVLRRMKDVAGLRQVTEAECAE